MDYPLSQSKDLSHEPHAMACRIAGLAFMNGVTEGWSKGDLAVWLAGPYRAVAASGRSTAARTEPHTRAVSISVDARSRTRRNVGKIRVHEGGVRIAPKRREPRLSFD